MEEKHSRNTRHDVGGPYTRVQTEGNVSFTASTIQVVLFIELLPLTPAPKLTPLRPSSHFLVLFPLFTALPRLHSSPLYFFLRFPFCFALFKMLVFTGHT